MKRLTLFAFLLFSCSIFYAQAVSIDNVPVPVSYYRLPDNPLNTSYTTYSAELDIDFRDLSKIGYTQSTLIDEYLR
nr:hypothetical protein [Bacteroidota bacterium]